MKAASLTLIKVIGVPSTCLLMLKEVSMDNIGVTKKYWAHRCMENVSIWRVSAYGKRRRMKVFWLNIV